MYSKSKISFLSQPKVLLGPLFSRVCPVLSLLTSHSTYSLEVLLYHSSCDSIKIVYFLNFELWFLIFFIFFTYNCVWLKSKFLTIRPNSEKNMWHENQNCPKLFIHCNSDFLVCICPRNNEMLKWQWSPMHHRESWYTCCFFF